MAPSKRVRLFGKHASEVTLAEAAYMAAVLPAPTYYSPYGNNKAALDKRKNLVLSKMLEHGYITAQEYTEAKAVQVAFVAPRTSSIHAPHFVFYVQQYLENKYGEDALERGGWSIITTLDADLQVKAEEVVQAKAESNQKTSTRQTLAWWHSIQTTARYYLWLVLVTTSTKKSMATSISRLPPANQGQHLSLSRMQKHSKKGTAQTP